MEDTSTVLKITILEDSKNKIQHRLDKENQRLSKIQQKIRDIRKCFENNPFDFNQQDNEVNLNAFLAVAENNKTKIDRTLVADVILDSQRDKY